MLECGKLEHGVLKMVDTESLAPQNHLLRKIDAAVDWERLYAMMEPLYSEDPVVLVKEAAANTGSLSPKAVFIDGTHIKAGANMKKQVKAVIPVASQRYAQERISKVNADREAPGKTSFEDEKPSPAPPKKRRDNTSGKKLASAGKGRRTALASFPEIETVAADSSCKTLLICKKVFDNGPTADKRPITMKGGHEWWKMFTTTAMAS